MEHSERTFDIEGLTPLMMENGRTANPLDPMTKELKKYTGKGKKTDEDHASIARLEWFASLYLNDEGALCVPGEALQAALADGATAMKLGKAFKGSVFATESSFPLKVIPNLKSVDAMQEDPQFRKVTLHKVGQARVPHTRPMFQSWSLRFAVSYDPELIDAEQVIDAAKCAGRYKGLLASRSRGYGRFTVK